MARAEVIRAAGVVALRERDGVREVLVVHREVHDDWSLPKGKLDPGESRVAAAVRECDEETGIVPVLGVPLPTQAYRSMGVPKVVSYWAATVSRDEGFYRDDEIDAIAWIPVSDAKERLSYPSDHGLVKLAAATPPTRPLIVARHAIAVKRAAFNQPDDHLRPLSGLGRSQARRLVPLFGAFGIESIHTSPATRCAATATPYSQALGRPMALEPTLEESAHEADVAATSARVAQLARDPRPLLLCSHRPVLPTILGTLSGELGIDMRDKKYMRAMDARLTPGSFIVIHRAFDEEGSPRVIGVERHTLEGE